MKIKDLESFQRAQKSARVATKSDFHMRTKEKVWSLAMISLRKAYGL